VWAHHSKPANPTGQLTGQRVSLRWMRRRIAAWFSDARSVVSSQRDARRDGERC
jgi:hypothetical protein